MLIYFGGKMLPKKIGQKIEETGNFLKTDFLPKVVCVHFVTNVGLLYIL
jgi:hypothetical protein